MSSSKFSSQRPSQFELQNSKIHLEEIGSSIREGLNLVAAESVFLKSFEQEFVSAATLDQILGIVSKSLKRFVQIVEEKLLLDRKCGSSNNLESTKAHPLAETNNETENYSNLEKLVQKYESEIREHIRVQQELRLYSEDLLEKFDEMTQTNRDLRKKVAKLETNLSDQTVKLKKAIEENSLLSKRLQKLELRRASSSFMQSKRTANMSADAVG